MSAEFLPRLKKARKPQRRSLALRAAIIAEAQKYERFSARGMYYRMEMAGLVPKTEAGCDRVGDFLEQLRLDHSIPWGQVVDGSRTRAVVSAWDNAREILETAARVYRQDYWASQGTRVEIWCEKDALSGLIEPICEEYGVTYVATRGSPSLTLLYESAMTIATAGKWWTEIGHLGDHDPTGVIIDPNIEARINWFLREELMAENVCGVRVQRLALTPEQVLKYGLPTREAKRSDTRCESFVEEFGSDDCTELDALAPDVLQDIVRSFIEYHIDRAAWERLEKVEEAERETLAAYAKAKGKLRRKRKSGG
jgi:hypothetical protein